MKNLEQHPLSAAFPAMTWLELTDLKADIKANGLIAGQYIVPTFDYLFAEGQPGAVPPASNFQCLAFLANGWGNGGLIIPRLDPWPGAIVPTAVNCATAN